MTREAINELKKYTLGKKNTEIVEINVLHLNRVIKALEQQSCEDCISREGVIDALDQSINLLEATDRIKDLPSINAVTIPKGATNGDMIKATFNPYKIFKGDFNVRIYMTERDFEESDYQMNYDRSWWNAPYKAESEGEK